VTRREQLAAAMDRVVKRLDEAIEQEQADNE